MIPGAARRWAFSRPVGTSPSTGRPRDRASAAAALVLFGVLFVPAISGCSVFPSIRIVKVPKAERVQAALDEARAADRKGEMRSAAEAYRRATETDPNDPHLWNERIESLERARSIEAPGLIAELDAWTTDSFVVPFVRGRLEPEASGRKRWWTEAWRARPDPNSPILAPTWIAPGDLDAVAEHLALLDDLEPRTPDLEYAVLSLRLELGRVDEVEARLSDAPLTTSDRRVIEADVARIRGDLAGAYQRIQGATSHRPEAATVEVGIRLAAGDRHGARLAVEHYRTAHRATAGTELAVAWTCAETGQLAAARRAVERAREFVWRPRHCIVLAALSTQLESDPRRIAIDLERAIRSTTRLADLQSLEAAITERGDRALLDSLYESASTRRPDDPVLEIRRVRVALLEGLNAVEIGRLWPVLANPTPERIASFVAQRPADAVLLVSRLVRSPVATDRLLGVRAWTRFVGEDVIPASSREEIPVDLDRDHDERVRGAALRLLAATDAETLGPAIERGLRDDSQYVRELAQIVRRERNEESNPRE